MIKQFSDNKIKDIYKMICDYHCKYLDLFGVKLPKLTNNQGNYTKDALVLVYLVQDYPKTRIISKSELTQFIRKYYPATNDVQQARHLGAQKGWFIVAGGRGDINIPVGGYKLITLKTTYPAFHGHRIEKTDNWDSIKSQYGNRCATCGSEQGKPNIHLAQYNYTITNKPHGSNKTFNIGEYHSSMPKM